MNFAIYPSLMTNPSLRSFRSRARFTRAICERDHDRGGSAARMKRALHWEHLERRVDPRRGICTSTLEYGFISGNTMITFLHGILVEKQPTRIVVDVAGVGYEVHIPLSSYDRLPHKDEECRVLTHDYVREDTHQLFGFMTEAERSMFMLLIGVSGIGPRIAMGALSGLSVRELHAAIGNSDVKRLSSISGLGKKTAERMIIELRDKLSKGDLLAATAASPAEAANEQRLQDAVSALISLGYNEPKARTMTSNALKRNEGQELSVEDLIKRALSS